MVLRAAVLIILSTAALCLIGSAQAREPACLECHSAHYQEKGECIYCHRGDPRSTRPTVAHRGLIPGDYAHFAIPEDPITKRGQKHLKTAGCRRCHLIGGRGNELAADLDPVTQESAPAELFDAVDQPALLMPDFHFPESQIIELVNALLAASRKSGTIPDEAPRMIHFAEEGKQEEDVFSRNCGDCHRLLSPVLGGLGEGKIGPNLSGLLTEYYPRFFRKKERWSVKNLKKWLKNPRNIRPWARMPPVSLKKKELNKLTDILEAEAVQGKQDSP